MKRLYPLGVLAAAVIGYHAGQMNLMPVIPIALAQQPQPPAGPPFGFNRPTNPALAPDAPPETIYWSIDDVRKAHADLVQRAAAQTTGGIVGGGSLVRVRTRTHSMSMFYRAHHNAPVASLTKKMSVWDDAEQHAGVYDFYIITGGTGEMVVGGEIEGRQNLADAAGPVPGEYRGQPIRNGKTYKVKPGDWMLIPPDTPHQPKPDAGGFSYMLMKINVGMYPWNLIR